MIRFFAWAASALFSGWLVSPAWAAAPEEYARAIGREACAQETLGRLTRAIAYAEGFGLDCAEPAAAAAKAGEELAGIRRDLGGRGAALVLAELDFGAIGVRLDGAERLAQAAFESLAPALAAAAGAPPIRTAEAFAQTVEFCVRHGARPASAGATARGLAPEEWAALSALGFSAVSPDPALWGGESLWRGPGDFDFSALDALLAANARMGARTEIRLGSAETAPGWLAAVHAPDALFSEGADGQPSHILSFFQPAARAYLLDYARAVAGHCRDSAQAARYALYDPPNLALAAECEPARAGFRQWLRTKYASLDSLNDAWQTRFVEWGDVLASSAPNEEAPDPRASAEAFERFKRESLAAFYEETARAIGAVDPECPIVLPVALAANPASRWTETAAGFEALAAGAFDGFALDGIAGDFRRLAGAAADPGRWMTSRIAKYRWLADPRHSAVANQSSASGASPSRQQARARANLWLDWAWNARGFDFGDPWRMSGDGETALFFAEQGGAAAPCHAAGALFSTAREIAAVEALAGETKLASFAAAALIPETEWALGAVSPAASHGSFALASGLSPSQTGGLFRDLAEGLARAGAPPRLILESRIAIERDALQGAQTLVAAEAACLHSAALKNIERWTADGGALISLGPFGAWDQFGREPKASFVQDALHFSELQRDAMGLWLDNGRARRELTMAPYWSGRVYSRLTIAPTELGLAIDQAAGEVAHLRRINADFRRVACVERIAADGAPLIVAVNLDDSGSVNGVFSVRGRFGAAFDLTAGGAPMPVKHNLGWTQAPLILEPGQAIVARFALESGSEQ